MTKKSIAKVFDELDDELTSRRGKASLSTRRSESTPATKGNQDIGERKEDNKGEVKPKGGGVQEAPEGVHAEPSATKSKACKHCGK